MSKFKLLLISITMAIDVLAQAPLGITHQAVIRDASNQLIVNSVVGVRTSILKGSYDGIIVYSETHNPVSNINGLISFVIGQGTAITGIFSLIDWANDSYFVRVEADPTGGTNYTISGTTQLMSVPYSLHSSHAGSLTLQDSEGARYRIGVDTNGNLTTELIVDGICGYGFLDYRDGKTYTTVLIGDQCWMQENLAYLPSVSPSQSGSYNEEYYYVFGYQGNNVLEAKQHENYGWYGVLYNWPAAVSACPSGWHLPDLSEWNTLITFLGGWELAGGKLKSTRTDPDPHPRWDQPNTGATNTSNFNGLPGGLREDDGNFNVRGQYGIWWVNEEENPSRALHNNLGWDMVYLYQGANEKNKGFSVRCVKDE